MSEPKRRPLTLDWQPLARPERVVLPETGPGGTKRLRKVVYIWGFKLPQHDGGGDRFVPFYVGRARDINTRLLDHLCAIKGGRYALYQRQALLLLHERGAGAVPEHGKAYVPDSPSDFMRFHTDANLQALANYMVDTFYFSYAALEDPIDSACVVRHVADCIGRDRLGTLVTGRSERYDLRHTGDAAITGLLTRQRGNGSHPKETP